MSLHPLPDRGVSKYGAYPIQIVFRGKGWEAGPVCACVHVHVCVGSKEGWSGEKQMPWVRWRAGVNIPAWLSGLLGSVLSY